MPQQVHFQEAFFQAVPQHIKTEAQYETALERVSALMQLDLEPCINAGDELKALSLLIKEYENRHYPVSKPHPIQ